MLRHIINLLPFVVAGIIAAWRSVSLHNQGIVKNKIATVLGVFLFCAAVGKIVSGLILRNLTPYDVMIHLVFALVGAVVYAFLGIRRKPENSTSPGDVSVRKD